MSPSIRSCRMPGAYARACSTDAGQSSASGLVPGRSNALSRPLIALPQIEVMLRRLREAPVSEPPGWPRSAGCATESVRRLFAERGFDLVQVLRAMISTQGVQRAAWVRRPDLGQ